MKSQDTLEMLDYLSAAIQAYKDGFLRKLPSFSPIHDVRYSFTKDEEGREQLECTGISPDGARFILSNWGKHWRFKDKFPQSDMFAVQYVDLVHGIMYCAYVPFKRLSVGIRKARIEVVDPRNGYIVCAKVLRFYKPRNSSSKPFFDASLGNIFMLPSIVKLDIF